MTDEQFLSVLAQRTGELFHDKWMKPIRCSRKVIQRLRRVANAVGSQIVKHPTEEKYCILMNGPAMEQFPVASRKLYIIRDRNLKGDAFILQEHEDQQENDHNPRQ